MPRFSRISWKSRDEAEPPRIASSSEAGEAAPVGARDAGRAEADVVLLGVLALEAEAGLAARGRAAAARAASASRQLGAAVDRLLHELDEPLVLDVARRPRRRRSPATYIERW